MRLVAGAAVDGGELQPCITAQQFRILVDLQGQFPGGGQNHGPGTGAILLDGSFHQIVQGGQQKGGRLAGAGLGLAGNVHALEGQGQGGRLNGGTVDETRIFQSLLQALSQGQCLERGVGQMVVFHGRLGFPAWLV